MEHETFFTLLCDLPHWEFELFLILLFDVIIGFLVWPRVRKAITHHESDDQKIAKLEKQVKELQQSICKCKCRCAPTAEPDPFK